MVDFPALIQALGFGLLAFIAFTVFTLVWHGDPRTRR